MMRRIALISEHASPLGLLGGADSGGQNVYVGRLARCLAQSGHTVDIFTRRDHGDLPETVAWGDGVRIVHVPAGPSCHVRKEELLPYMEAFTAFVRRFCAQQERPYDLVHANFFMSGIVAMALKQSFGTPFVITFHALGRVRRLYQREADDFPDERFAVEERLVREADRIIAECPQDEADLVGLYNAEPAKIAVIPCGFDPAEFAPVSKPLARIALGMPPEQRLVVQVGRLVPRKGVDNVVRGFARLTVCHGIAAHLAIVGGESNEPDPVITPEIGRLQAIAVQEGVAGQVTFVGRRGRAALKDYYSAADVFVTTPWYEPFGITPVEAMACGTPVVGADVGGIKFSVAHGETGYLVPPNDPEALAERIAYLYAHPQLLAEFGRQAIRRSNDFFTWQRVATMVAALYEDVLVTSPTRPGAAVHGRAIVDRGFGEAVSTLQESHRCLPDAIVAAAAEIVACFARGGKLLICGNGGSAADAQHFATEFMGRFKQPGRAALPAVALTGDTTFLTAWSNDSAFDEVFSRQVEALGRQDDLLIGISTSGRSGNVVQAFATARRLGVHTLALLGGDGGALRSLAEHAVIVPAADTQRIQEVHILVIHMLCELVEDLLAQRVERCTRPAARTLPAVAQAMKVRETSWP